MSLDPHYQCDTEFVKLLSRRTNADLTLAALELARDAYPDLDFRQTLGWIDERGLEVAGPIARAESEREALEQLGECLAGRYGIYGDAEAYERADSSYLPRIIETGRGIPISLSILYMAVAGRAGLDLKPVAAPLHFLLRYESIEGPLFIDAFSRARILTARQCVNWLCEISRLPPSRVRRLLVEASPRCVVIRMLNNLKVLHMRQENWDAAWIVQHRLAALQPGAWQERLDLAVISIRANRPGHAIDLLQSCIGSCPQSEKPSLQEQLAEAYAQQSMLN